jgi:hypothetical protein
LRLISQINVIVGGFFVISGYVAAYTTTELGERKYTAARLDDTIKFATSRIMGFYSLHFLVLVIFGAMFVWTDATFSGPLIAAWHGIISLTLTSAWFPLSAEVWNAPTWFLSAFAFCLVLLPHGLKLVGVMSKSELRRTIAFLTIASIVPKLAYSYDLKAWTIFEGMLNARSHPNYAFFNGIRFNPLLAFFEVLMGATACRLVMLDTEKETSSTGSSFLPLAAMLAIIVLRASDVIAINDMIVRGCFFIPLFLAFLMRVHRETVSGPGLKLVVKFFTLPLFMFLGGISFPMFILHGPIGQLFYKKAVATQVWGGPLNKVVGEWFFGIFWLVVIVAAYASQKLFLEKKIVKDTSAAVDKWLCTAIKGAVSK